MLEQVQTTYFMQNEPNNHTYRREGKNGKNSNFTQISTDIDCHRLRHLGSSLDLCFPSFKKDDTRGANSLFEEKSGTLGGKFDNNSTESEIATVNCEYNVLERDFETKRNGCEIHDGCVNSLRSTSEYAGSRNEGREHASVKMGGGCEECPNRGRIGEMQARFGKLFRIGSLAGDVWKSTTPRKPCTFVHAHSRFTNEESTIERKISMSPVQACGGNDVSPSCCDNDLILVDTFEDKSRIANSITLKIFDSDPKELIYYITCVAEFGFDHIIIIGETYGGLIFLDCYGRVFLWDDENLLLFPLWNSPEEASNYSFKKDRLGWFVENGIVYEYILKFH